MLSPPKVSPAVRQIHPEALNIFRDAYNVEFLGLPQTHAEADLHRGLLDKLKDFLIELGRDFCFVASEYPLQVGGRDFALDLLFFHRGLNCLVAIELKVGRFEPEYLGRLAFYLEALDRDVRKAHEQPSIGVLLCASKNDEVVEYALSRSLSPALIAESNTAARQEAAPGQTPRVLPSKCSGRRNPNAKAKWQTRKRAVSPALSTTVFSPFLNPLTLYVQCSHEL
ncbi:PDDEXK nuclease domain-containing protein [Tunturiibacter psychrotolerans]|uniref:PDDEXK nuclease domain-containing protein n=1 Tax=Tunturiibacter psychrotolerans TaxID=3069686 RepID=UPI003D205138